MNNKLFFSYLRRIMSVALVIFILLSAIMLLKGFFVKGDINILVLATDKGQLLTDTIMVANVNTHTKSLNIMSLPRDTRVMLDSGNHVKLNSVYQREDEKKRPQLVKRKIEDMLDLKLDYYVVIHPDGFRNVIDALGGVDFYVPMNMHYDDPSQGLSIHLNEGMQHLDGNMAEQYVRYRSGYANADLGRIHAQQEFLKELYKQKLNAKTIAKLPSIYKKVKDDFKTNIGLSDISRLAKTLYKFNDATLNTYQLPSSPQYIGGASYMVQNEEETKKLIDNVFKADKKHSSEESSDENVN